MEHSKGAVGATSVVGATTELDKNNYSDDEHREQAGRREAGGILNSNSNSAATIPDITTVAVTSKCAGEGSYILLGCGGDRDPKLIRLVTERIKGSEERVWASRRFGPNCGYILQ